MMLLRQLNSELVQDFPSVSLKSGVKCAVTIDDDESKGRLIDEQFFLEVIKVKLGVAVIDGEIDWFEGFKVTDELSFRGGVFIHDLAREDDKAVIRSTLVKFESFPG